MKRAFDSALATVVLAGVCIAQAAEPQGSTSHQTPITANQSNGQASLNSSPLPAGTILQAELIKPIDARKNKSGDEVLAKVTHDVKGNDNIVIPKGSRLVGHLTEVKSGSKNQATSDVGIVFDRAVLKNGTDVAVALKVQAIGRRAAPPGESELASGTTTVAPGGLLGGVGSTTTGAASDVGSSARSATLAPTSQGVVGLRGLTLSNQTSASASAQGSVISSSTGNVYLDSGTEMVLRVSQ